MTPAIEAAFRRLNSAWEARLVALGAKIVSDNDAARTAVIAQDAADTYRESVSASIEARVDLELLLGNVNP